MLDPSKLMSLLTEADSVSQSSHSSLSGSFLGAAGGMSLTGGGEMSQVISAVSAANANASAGMNNILKGFQSNVDKMHATQREARPSDFDKGIMDDLRKKATLGFPREAKSFFDTLPKA